MLLEYYMTNIESGEIPVQLTYFEDFSIGEIIPGEQDYEVTRDEIIEFARKWDPHPFHVDEEAAGASLFKGLTAPATLVVAIAGWLWHRTVKKPALTAGLGWEEVRFLAPARPGDRLSITLKCIDARLSGSRPDCGILSTEIMVTNQNGEPVLSILDSCLVKKRPE